MTPGFVGRPFGVWRKNLSCAGCLKNARGAKKSLAKMSAVEWGERVVRNGMAFRVDGDAAAIAVAEQDADRRDVRKFFQQ